ncbi:hypothetical protein OQ483_09615 [Enterobacter bugandensis]|uniref:hypothetical protein n=1 Tax=Enterobacter TaxID=547 RepID=UPI0022E461C2|nr:MULTISPECIES: hypothetical protein [Enterobacter]MEA5212818.1 hypothetical protein [Enterobacter cloacae]WMU74630.1 hypothetical protein OQ483_09615 [Enterobacter bugandensis]
MKAVDLIKGMQARNISFRLLQCELKHYGMRSARGWADLIEEYKSLSTKKDDDNFNTIYNNFLKYSDRAVFFIEPHDKKHIPLIKKIFLNMVDANDRDYKIYEKAFPLPVNLGKHIKLKKLRPVCVDVCKEKNIILLTNTYLRPFKERTVIDTGTMSSSTQNELNFFDEIIGIKDRYIQCFDTISLDTNTGDISFEIDMTTNLSAEELENAATRYRRTLRVLCYKATKAHVLFSRKNIFSAIDTLYHSTDGTVLKLGHATKTGSIKEEKMRRKKDDLRKETYHSAGLAAIGGKTNNYSISKQWQGSHNNILTIHIPGHFSLISSTLPFINYAIIEGCCTKTDYELLISKVI